MSTMIAIATITVSSTSSMFVEFTNIPQKYTDLVIRASARSTKSGTVVENFSIQPNGATSIFSWRILSGDGSTVTGSSGTNAYAPLLGTAATATSNIFSNGEAYIPNYTSSNDKIMISESVNENNATLNYLSLVGNTWQNSLPITSLTISAGGGNIVQYSTFTIYGVYRGSETQVEAPTIGTAIGTTPTSASISFIPSATGAPASSYIATSNPGNITGFASSSPIIVSGLTTGTSYTFTVKGENPSGYGVSSSASNSVTPETGSYVAIASASGSGTNSITFSNIPSVYKNLQIRAYMIGNGNNINLRFNGDSGNNYSFHQVYATNGSVGASGSASQNLIYLTNGPTNGTTPTSSVIDITDYASTNKNKTVKAVGGYAYTTAGEIYYRSGAWLNTSAVKSITITYGGSAFGSSNLIELFGIEG